MEFHEGSLNGHSLGNEAHTLKLSDVIFMDW